MFHIFVLFTLLLKSFTICPNNCKALSRISAGGLEVILPNVTGNVSLTIFFYLKLLVGFEPTRSDLESPVLTVELQEPY